MPKSRPQRRSPHARRQRAEPPSASEGTKGYSTREVAEVLGLPTSRILAWSRRGLISPRRGRGGAYVFSFQDLLLLRTARELLDADVPARRIRESIDALKEQLPVGRPLSAVTISALGDRVLVKDEDAMWEPDTGQIQMTFDTPDIVAEAIPERGESEPSVGSGAGVAASTTADDFYDTALDLEVDDAAGAIKAYLDALAVDPDHSDAHLNLGRLLHEEGRVEDAERHYRLASEADPTSARALYNLGVALDDRGAPAAAIESYEAAVRLDPGLGAAHFNLSRLYESDGRQADALQHLAAYRQLIARDTE